ncbi:hypothetical protein B0T21DRAFT_347552 [Apiosordaria backusii]|uniref:Uncharacterized protein n=1 Tax=Apiosordaria backusii TaxID=314023 RepID=A0AA40BMV3_9PEZI|nr:hypothetical protein B0T21DRAFT_347552 [Apiosordaria backusii]
MAWGMVSGVSCTLTCLPTLSSLVKYREIGKKGEASSTKLYEFLTLDVITGWGREPGTDILKQTKEATTIPRLPATEHFDPLCLSVAFRFSVSAPHHELPRFPDSDRFSRRINPINTIGPMLRENKISVPLQCRHAIDNNTIFQAAWTRFSIFSSHRHRLLIWVPKAHRI